MSDRHAVVIGASMGGLLAARVLSDSFDRVTLVDRDSLPRAGDQRKGCPRAATPTGSWPGAAPLSRSCSRA